MPFRANKVEVESMSNRPLVGDMGLFGNGPTKGTECEFMLRDVSGCLRDGHVTNKFLCISPVRTSRCSEAYRKL